MTIPLSWRIHIFMRDPFGIATTTPTHKLRVPTATLGFLHHAPSPNSCQLSVANVDGEEQCGDG